MERALTDLDELLLSVRDSFSKNYIAEAVLAYRSGAHRLAIVGAWTAASYDIIAKLRELKSNGDGQATSFIDRFDKAVEANHTANLLKYERELVDTAERLEFFNAQDALTLSRLREDRHLCAHPAFSHDNTLFRPSPESVRAHIVNTIEVLLAMPAVSGQAMFKVFSTDVLSAAFPDDDERAISYVLDRYVRRMRTNAKRNFAVVLFKALILHNVPAWIGHETSLVHALKALDRDDHTAFQKNYLTEASRIAEQTDEDGIFRLFSLIRAFPALRSLLASSTINRMHALVSHAPSERRIFRALGIINSDVDNALAETLETLPENEAYSIVQENRDQRYIAPIWNSVAKANTYRDGEARLRIAELFAHHMSGAQFAALVDIIGKNAQVWNAGRSPNHLAAMTRVAIQRGIAGTPDWRRFQARTQNGNYVDMWRALAESGIYAHDEADFDANQGAV